MSCTCKLPQAVAGQAVELARQYVYRFLSIALSDPQTSRWDVLLDEKFHDVAHEAVAVLREVDEIRASDLAPGESPSSQLDLTGAIAHLQNPFFDAEAEFRQTFGLLVSKKAPPYETEYCQQTLTVYRQQVMADIAGFYRAFGLEPSRELPERHDNAALELEFMAWLIAKEQRARQAGNCEQADVCRDAQRKFLENHIAWWMPAFATLLRLSCDAAVATDIAETPRTFYGAIAAAISAFVHAERTRFGIPAPTELSTPRQSSEAHQPEAKTCPQI